MTRIRWSPRAIRDLEDIDTRLPAARDLIGRIVDSVDHLKSFPELGRVVPELRIAEIRELIVRPFRVVYLVLPEAIEVVCVFHSLRRLPPLDS